jgi:Fe-S-cluster containining protein
MIAARGMAYQLRKEGTMMTLTDWLNRLFKKEEVCCLGCGDCCRAFSWHLHASDNDLARWRKLGRDDLLARVNRLGWIWVDPRTKERLPTCPYLIETAADKAHCGIHDIKPDICRAYPSQAQYRICLKGVFLS